MIYAVLQKHHKHNTAIVMKGKRPTVANINFKNCTKRQYLTNKPIF